MNMADGIGDVLVFEGVEVLLMGLELGVVVVFLPLLEFLGGVEDDEPASFIPQSQESSRPVEFHGCDVVFLEQFLALALVAEELRAAVAGDGLAVLVHCYLIMLNN